MAPIAETMAASEAKTIITLMVMRMGRSIRDGVRVGVGVGDESDGDGSDMEGDGDGNGEDEEGDGVENDIFTTPCPTRTGGDVATLVHSLSGSITMTAMRLAAKSINANPNAAPSSIYISMYPDMMGHITRASEPINANRPCALACLPVGLVGVYA